MSRAYIILALFLAVLPQTTQAAEFNVTEYGATAAGEADCTAAFQAAIDAANAANGGVVHVPTGRYRFDGTLILKHHVTLRGTFHYAPAHAGIRDGDRQPKPEFNTILEPHAGAGAETGDPFVRILGNATLQGFSIHYPDQDPKADAPTPYPFTIELRRNNPAIVDVELLNPYQAIDASKNQRALIRNVHGQPIKMGVFVDGIYDIGRIENVHWNPWWSYKTPVFEWQRKHGTAFYFGRTDWHYVLNTFCFGYNIGYHFDATEQGAANGNFLGIGADYCHTAVQLDETAPMGLLITNGEFVAFDGDDPVKIRAAESHTGTVRFSNCAFWGPCKQVAAIDGHGTVGFSDCTFMQWDHDREGRYCIEAKGGSLLIQGSEFLEDKNQILIHKEVERALVLGNLINGKKRIKTKGLFGKRKVKHNLATPKWGRWNDAEFKHPGFRTMSRRAEARKRLESEE